jgi:hypothetical protein
MTGTNNSLMRKATTLDKSSFVAVRPAQGPIVAHPHILYSFVLRHGTFLSNSLRFAPSKKKNHATTKTATAPQQPVG